VTLKRLTRLCN